MSGTCSICSKCIECQTLCQLGRELATANGAQLLPSISRDELVIKLITPDVIAAIAASITAAASAGAQQNSSPQGFGGIDPNFMYSGDINAFLQHIIHGALVGSTPGSVGRDDIIYASFWQAINDAIASLKVSPTACDQCNTACDTCNSCQHSSCHSSCHGSS